MFLLEARSSARRAAHLHRPAYLLPALEAAGLLRAWGPVHEPHALQRLRAGRGRLLLRVGAFR